MTELYKGSIFEAPVDIIVHQANCFNTMGSGIAKEIKRRYPRAAQVDRLTQKGDYKKLGLFTVAEPYEKQDKWIINLYGQFKYGRDKRYTDYQAVKRGLENLHSWLDKMNLTNLIVGMPYGMGCVRGGGDWNIVEGSIKEVFEKTKIKVLICKI